MVAEHRKHPHQSATACQPAAKSGSGCSRAQARSWGCSTAGMVGRPWRAWQLHLTAGSAAWSAARSWLRGFASVRPTWAASVRRRGCCCRCPGGDAGRDLAQQLPRRFPRVPAAPGYVAASCPCCYALPTAGQSRSRAPEPVFGRLALRGQVTRTVGTPLAICRHRCQREGRQHREPRVETAFRRWRELGRQW